MAILNFQKPDKIILQKATDFEAQFEFRPLEPGYAVTIGNALRRVLLSSLEGYAITGVKIEGVDHEFATIKGVSEDVVEIRQRTQQAGFEFSQLVAIQIRPPTPARLERILPHQLKEHLAFLGQVAQEIGA